VLDFSVLYCMLPVPPAQPAQPAFHVLLRTPCMPLASSDCFFHWSSAACLLPLLHPLLVPSRHPPALYSLVLQAAPLALLSPPLPPAALFIAASASNARLLDFLCTPCTQPHWPQNPSCPALSENNLFGPLTALCNI